MTEEEAKTKWCPYARHAFTGDEFEIPATAVAANRMINKKEQSKGCNCIGSQCMAWRPDGYGYETKFIPMQDAIPEGWTVGALHQLSYDIDGVESKLVRSKLAKPTGYCGLAGKP